MLLIRTDVVESDREIIQDRGSTPHSAGLGWADIANNIGQTQCQLRWFAEGILNLAAALDYFERSGQTALAAQVREDLQSYRQDAAPQDPWTTARLGENGIGSPIPQAEGSRRSPLHRSAQPTYRSRRVLILILFPHPLMPGTLSSRWFAEGACASTPPHCRR